MHQTKQERRPYPVRKLHQRASSRLRAALRGLVAGRTPRLIAEDIGVSVRWVEKIRQRYADHLERLT